MAAELPSFGPASALRDLGDATLELLRVRVAHTLNGRSEEFRLRKAVEMLAVMPGGLAEQELRALVGGGALGVTPALLWGEIQHVLAPLIEERVSDGQLVLRLRHVSYALALCPADEARAAAAAELRDFFVDSDDFLEGGAINARKLRAVPSLLALCGAPGELEEHLCDLNAVELKLCSSQLFDLLLQLPAAGPGDGGRLEDLLAFLRDFADTLTDNPRMLLQNALNMPDASGVCVEGVRLDQRRRRGHFHALALQRDSAGQSAAQIMARRKRAAASGKGDPDLQALHPRAMAWRAARPWVRWLNKPQTRGQCKLVIRGHQVPSCSHFPTLTAQAPARGRGSPCVDPAESLMPKCRAAVAGRRGRRGLHAGRRGAHYSGRRPQRARVVPAHGRGAAAGRRARDGRDGAGRLARDALDGDGRGGRRRDPLGPAPSGCARR